MKTLLKATVILIAAASSCAAQIAPNSFAPAVESAMPAVVNISTTQSIDVKSPFDDLRNEIPEGSPFEFFFRDFLDREFNDRSPGEFGQRKRKAISLGSGFIIDEEGYIVTNQHVIESADQISVTLSDDQSKSYPAKVIGIDKKTDLALLKIDAKKKLPFLRFGNADETRVGDWIVAIGNPFGLGGSVTAGIVSAKARSINGQYDEFIQTDASINRGNSGGPMLNMKSEVIGINSVIISPSGGNIGIGFAIPANQAEPILKQLREKGSIVRGWLGVAIQPINEDIAKNLGVENNKGALVAEVVKDSPAEKAGVKIGDIILTFDGAAIDKPQKLSKVVAETPINKKSILEIIRDGKQMKVEVMIAKLDDKAAAPNKDDPALDKKSGDFLLGMKLENLDDANRTKFKVDKSVTGIIVSKVARNSPASDVGIKTGDVIMQVNKLKVKNTAEAVTEIKKVQSTGMNNIVLLISRGGTNRFIVMDME